MTMHRVSRRYMGKMILSIIKQVVTDADGNSALEFVRRYDFDTEHIRDDYSVDEEIFDWIDENIRSTCQLSLGDPVITPLSNPENYHPVVWFEFQDETDAALFKMRWG